MISDRDAVLAAASTYGSAPPSWQVLNGAISVFVTERDGLKLIAIEGTHDPLGWAIDFAAVPARRHFIKRHAGLGPVHGGFLAAAENILPQLALAALGKPYVLIGHSLGAGQALLCGALMKADGNPPAAIFAFAPPRVGFAPFVASLGGIPVKAWRFGNDPVPMVPLTLPPWWRYQQVPLIAIGAPRPDAWSCHGIENYVDAIPAEPAIAPATS